MVNFLTIIKCVTFQTTIFRQRNLFFLQSFKAKCHQNPRWQTPVIQNKDFHYSLTPANCWFGVRVSISAVISSERGQDGREELFWIKHVFHIHNILCTIKFNTLYPYLRVMESIYSAIYSKLFHIIKIKVKYSGIHIDVFSLIIRWNSNKEWRNHPLRKLLKHLTMERLCCLIS